MANDPRKQPSKAVVIKSLQTELKHRQREYEQLVVENASLRTKEDVLLQQVTQQGDNLHFIVLAAAQTHAGQGTDMPDMAKTLMQDLEVYELMGMLGKSPNSPSAEPFTTQRLRAAVTPERVAAMRNVTVEEVAAHLKQLTMRMCMLLAGGPEKAALFADSIESVVNEYGEYGLLLHVAADWVNLQIGTLNLETLQVQEPPLGYWERVVDSLELQEQQVQTLAAGFDSYQQKSKAFISGLHSTVGSIRAILGCSDGADSTQQQGTSLEPEGPYQQFLHNRLSVGNNGSFDSSFSSSDSYRWREGSNNSLPGTAAATPAAAAMGPHGTRQQCGSCSQHGRACAGSCHAAAAAADASGRLRPSPGSTTVSTTKSWQEFGLSHGSLTAESAQQLEQLMQHLMQQVMKLREMHRTVTWLFLNTLNARQHALFITGSWPWWSRPLTMCQYIAEQYEQRQQRQRQPSQQQQPKLSGGQAACSGGHKAPRTTPSRASIDVTAAATTAALAFDVRGLQLGGFAALPQHGSIAGLSQLQVPRLSPQDLVKFC